MKLIIDIDEVFYEALRETDVIIRGQRSGKTLMSVICNAVANGKPLPKGHGRLIDADAFERRCMFDSDIEDMQDVIYALRDYKSIIEADKAESEGK